MKSDQTIIRKNHMEPLHFITKLLDIKDPNIQIMDVVNKDTHKEIIAKLDYDAPSCPDCGNQMKKYDFQKSSKTPYLETTGMPTRILLKKRRFKCYQCSKMMVSETSLVKKNHQISTIIKQKSPQNQLWKPLWQPSLEAWLSLLRQSFVNWKNSNSRQILTTFQNTWAGRNTASRKTRWASLHRISIPEKAELS